MSAAGDAALAMDRIYRHQQAIYDLTRRHYLLGRDRLIDGLNPPAGARVLEIGCGTGRNLVACAARHPQARLYGLDVSQVMLETAGRAVWRAGLVGRVRLARADATRFAPQPLFGETAFERIFISYSLSMIPAWHAVVENALGALAPGGEIHIVDFGQQEGLPRWFRAALHRWLSWFSVHPIAGLEGALGVIARRHGATLSFARPWRGYAVLAVLRAG